MPAPTTTRETLITWYIEEHSTLNAVFTKGVEESTRHEGVMNQLEESSKEFEQNLSQFKRLDAEGFINADGEWSAKGKRFTGWTAKRTK